jgi:hypothetical protein
MLMAGKADFTEAEWESLHLGLTGAGMLFTRRLSAKPDFGSALLPLALGLLECVEAPPNRLPVDLELLGEVGLMLALPNTPPDLPDLLLRQLGFRRHAPTLRSCDIS